MLEEFQICKKCNIKKPLSQYKKTIINNKAYYRKTCQNCLLEERRIKYKNVLSQDEEYKRKARERAKAYHYANQEDIKVKSKKYRETHKEQIKEYRETHKDLYKSYKQTEKYKEYTKKYKKENKDKINAYRKIFRQEHREEYLQKKKKWDRKYTETHKEERKKYRLENRELINKIKREYHAKRIKDDPLYKLEKQLRGTVLSSFKRRGYKKNSHTFEIIGMEWDDFYKYLLETFRDNYGYDWDGIENVHIDHIIPLAIAETEIEIYELCKWNNLQLLKAKDNLDKKDKLDWEIIKDSK